MFTRIPAILLTILALASPVNSDCRRVVVRKNNVAVVQAVATVFAVIPFATYSVGYAPVYPSYPQQPSAKVDDDVKALLRAVLERLDRLERGGAAPKVAETGKLSFLSDVNRCGKCHANGQAKGGLDLSKGLDGLTDKQLGLLTIRTSDPTGKDGLDPMPPLNVQDKNEPLSDEEYITLRKATAQRLASK